MLACLVSPLLLETSIDLLFFPELNPCQRAKHTLPGVFGLFQGKEEPVKRLIQVLRRSFSHRQTALKADEVVRGVGQRVLHSGHRITEIGGDFSKHARGGGRDGWEEE